MIDIEERPPPAMPPPRRRFMRIPLVLLSVIALSVLVAGWWYSRAMGGSEEGAPVTFVVEGGSTARSIAEQLEERGIIRSSFAMLMHLRMSGDGALLKPGVYEMRHDLGVQGVLDQLLKGVPLEVIRFTVPEGKTLGEIATIVDQRTGVNRQEFLAAAKRERHRPSFLPDRIDTLEGVLFPDTYEIFPDSTADDIVAMMVRRFEGVLADLPTARAKRLGVSVYETVVIASLIEREARIQKDRPLISSVIYNRLAIPMRLQIDATVQYALFQRDGRYAEVVLFRDLEIDSPHNTYRNDGLPPTPIAVPGAAALAAAFTPAQTDFLYYVACGGEGGHAFGRTSSDHERNIERCLR